jgi:hypothetical protein
MILLAVETSEPSDEFSFCISDNRQNLKKKVTKKIFNKNK